jgi:glycosyltransferase involved in cell wall biosynthesis
MSQFSVRKVSVLIASTLKPIRDVRAYKKLALSLGETNKYELNIIGFSPKKPKSEPGIRIFSSIKYFESKSDRIFAQLRFLSCLLRVRPKVLICCSYELLPIASSLKPLLGYKLVYDVQENYRANLDLNESLSLKQRNRADKLIRRAESVWGIDLYLLAERCYAQEMPEKVPFLILENKYEGEIHPIQAMQFRGRERFRFCISGTITPAFGPWDAIGWFREILRSYPESELVIVGHCPIESFWVKLTQVANGLPQLSLRISRNPVPHEEIIEALTQADFALLPYQDHPAISGKMPTKLFECAALGIPVLISRNLLWESFLAKFDGGCALDFSDATNANRSFEEVLKRLFFKSTPPETVLWKTEKLHFQEAIANLLA